MTSWLLTGIQKGLLFGGIRVGRVFVTQNWTPQFVEMRGTKCVTTVNHKNRHSCFYPVLICFVSHVQGVTAVITVTQPWFHQIFLSCFNRLFIKNRQPASNRAAHSQPRRPETLFHITTVASNLCLFPYFHATALIFLPAVPVVVSSVWHHHSAPEWGLDDPWCTSDATRVWCV